MLCAVCPTGVTITSSAGPPYKSGDRLTCTADGSPSPSYKWTDNNNRDRLLFSTRTVTLAAGAFDYKCTATVDGTCSASASFSGIAFGKYQKQRNKKVKS